MRFVMNRLLSAILLTPLVFSVIASERSHAQTNGRSINSLYTDLQAAVCLNDWDEALTLINPMIGSSEISGSYREELIRFRRQLQDWRATQAEFPSQPQCENATADVQRTATSSRGESSQPAISTANQDLVLTPTNSRSPETRPANTAAPLLSQCIELGNVINWTDSQATSLFERTDLSDLNALVRMLSGLAGLSEQALSSLYAINLNDGQLQTYQQNFISVYQGFSQVTRDFVSAANAGDFSNMEEGNAQIQNLANQELSLISQVNAYCGRDIIANQ